MRLRTRLLLPLIATVTAVMALYAAWALRQREATLTAEDRREAATFANALGLALEAALVDPEWRGVQDVVERLTRDPQVHGVRVYRTDGSVAFESANLRGEPRTAAERVRAVFERGDTATFERDLDEARMQVLLRPLRGEDGELIGAFELTLALSFVDAEIARTRTRFLLNTMTLIIALTVLTLWLVRRQIGEPLERLVAGVQAVGAGELAFRIQEDPRAVDLAVVAREFNSMARRLEQAREDVLREADERVDLERRFRETDKLAAVGRLAAGLAHEIATPLQIIKGRTDMLEGGDVKPEVYARNVRIIGDQVDRVARLVRGLLNLSRRPELHVTSIVLGDLVAEVSDVLETELERADVTLLVEELPEATIEGDRSLLHQALMNLLLNAIQALEDRAEERAIAVRARVEDLSAGTAANARRFVTIEVEDTGPGIPVEPLDRIFEPFFSTKAEAHGTGLGLSVAQSIVEEHGGAIRVQNVIRSTGDGAACVSGALFSIELPLAAAERAMHA
jgi:two-component system, NtrC family, sensor histidine kinase HydH